MNINGSVALVTGANRGIGRAFVEALVQAGATRIYATARDVDSLKEVFLTAPDLIIPLKLDVTNLEQIVSVAEMAQDVNLLINNAGIVGDTNGYFAPASVEVTRSVMETNYFGILNMIRAFAPVLKQNGGGAIANILSIASVVSTTSIGSYCASKAASYSLTKAVRAELAQQGTLVVGVFPGPVDTELAKIVPLDKVPPMQIAQATLQAIEQRVEDVQPDPISQEVFAKIRQDPKALEKQFANILSQ